jgi:hypothetical protein
MEIEPKSSMPRALSGMDLVAVNVGDRLVGHHSGDAPENVANGRCPRWTSITTSLMWIWALNRKGDQLQEETSKSSVESRARPSIVSQGMWHRQVARRPCRLLLPTPERLHHPIGPSRDEFLFPQLTHCGATSPGCSRRACGIVRWSRSRQVFSLTPETSPPPLPARMGMECL